MVSSLDPHWHSKYAEGPGGELVPVLAGGSDGHEATAEDTGPHEDSDDGHGAGHGHGIHMPSPSYFPVVAALGLPILAYGLLYSSILVVDGAITILVGVYGWAVEPSAEPAE